MCKLISVQRICGSSVDDGVFAVRRSDDLELMKECLKYEQEHGNRKGLIRSLSIRIWKLSSRANGQ